MILVLTTQTDFFFACGCICVCSCASMCICLHSYAQLYATLILQTFQVQGACVKRYIKWNHIRTWKTLAFPMSLHPNYPPTIFSCAMFWLLKVWINISFYVALSEFPAVDIKRGLHYVSRIFVTANKLVEKDLVLLVFFWMSVKFSFSFETKKYARFDTGLIKLNVDGPNFILSLIVRNGKKTNYSELLAVTVNSPPTRTNALSHFMLRLETISIFIAIKSHANNMHCLRIVAVFF